MKQDQYAKFAMLYDWEVKNPDIESLYDEWRNSLQLALKKYRLKVHTLVDLACGTGNTTVPWLNAGYKVIGVDTSKSMLSVANKKSKKIKWVCQDLTQLNLGEKVEAITCHFDALNHILLKNDLLKIFKRVHCHLVPGGIFQFDMTTEAWSQWLDGRDKLFPVGKHYFIASNKYNPKTQIAEFRQLWFVKESGKYKKVDIRIKERAYKENEIAEMLKQAGLILLRLQVQRKIEGKASRLLYLVRK